MFSNINFPIYLLVESIVHNFPFGLLLCGKSGWDLFPVLMDFHCCLGGLKPNTNLNWIGKSLYGKLSKKDNCMDEGWRELCNREALRSQKRVEIDPQNDVHVYYFLYTQKHTNDLPHTIKYQIKNSLITHFTHKQLATGFHMKNWFFLHTKT